MYEVGVVASFEASHQLHGDFGPASQPHGHAYRIEARVSGPSLLADGTLLDISYLQKAVSELTEALRGRSLNTIAELDAANPTAEVPAHYTWQAIAKQVRGASRLRVTVWESSEAFASFADDLS